MTNELKPCPFCGAGTTEVQEHAIWQGAKYAEPISVSVVHWCEPVEGQPSRMIQKVGRDRASAIAAWNRRSPAPGAGAAAMREALLDVARAAQEDAFESASRHYGSRYRLTVDLDRLERIVDSVVARALPAPEGEEKAK